MQEGDLGASIYEEGDRRWLKGFRNANVHFHLMAEPNLKSLKTKQKYRGLFDGGVLSINSAALIGDDFSQLFKDKARIHCETADYLIALTPEQRIQFRKEVLKKVTDSKWECLKDNPYKHHFLLQVNNPHYESEKSTAAEEEEDYMDLSGL